MVVLGRHYGRLLNWLPAFEGAVVVGIGYVAGKVGLGIGGSAAPGIALAGAAVPGTTASGAAAAGAWTPWLEAVVFGGALLLAFTTTGLYNLRLRDGIEGILVRIVAGCAIAALVLAGVHYALPEFFVARGAIALAFVASFASVVAIRWALHRLSRAAIRKRRVVVLGAGKRAGILARLRRRTDLIGIRIVGYVRYPGDRLSVPEGAVIDVDRPLVEWMRARDIDEVVVAPDERRQNLDMHELLRCRERGLLIHDLPTFYERETGRVSLEVLLPGWLAFSRGFRSAPAGDRLKRLFDIAASLGLLVAAAPVMLVAALAIWLESGGRGPILYRQRRVGANEREFAVYKFRSMYIDAESDGRARWAGDGDPRITRVGAVLRRYRIDELPQAINVLHGSMSFVGPRPERPEFVYRLEQHFPRYADRHRVKPGLTGWAQISYPYGASDRDAFEKLQYDLYYVKNHSLYLDLAILLQTAEVVLWGRGAR